MDNTATDPAYRAFIATIPCLICGRAAVVHHQNERYHGSKSMKASDYRSLPLCPDHHNGGGTELQPGSYHSDNWAFYEKYGIDVEAKIAQFNTIFFFQQEG
jgi:hypothetical protein